ncbi:MULTISPECIES: hypothetical protein [unclassified Rathayibacter]|uniref:hypothetical protein n=1 Tax=unclassified Rathayibacter TaxID=2609250 RepID=UPI0006F67248|nr:MULTISPECIES: hypothetical protein [unclassified Rathayibacter]KQQ05089.1 hypothetical protein ASF42_00205 [Rathayibacter sp. Leaf294]KQS12952.1 hypothetical protein ASG06_00205 [Rathayibacter sp. Leaf185]
MTDLEETATESTGLSRRHLAQAAGWSAPLVLAAVCAPAAQASVTPEPFDGLTGTWSAPEVLGTGIVHAVFTVTNTSQTPQQLLTLVFEYADTNIARSVIAGGPGNAYSYSIFNRGGELDNAAELYTGSDVYQPGQSVSFDCFTNRTLERGSDLIVYATGNGVPTSFTTVHMPGYPS